MFKNLTFVTNVYFCLKSRQFDFIPKQKYSDLFPYNEVSLYYLKLNEIYYKISSAGWKSFFKNVLIIPNFLLILVAFTLIF